MALTHQLFEPCSKIPFLGSLELPKGQGGLNRYMGKVKKFGASSTLIFRRNSHQKEVRAQCAPRTIRVNKISENQTKIGFFKVILVNLERGSTKRSGSWLRMHLRVYDCQKNNKRKNLYYLIAGCKFNNIFKLFNKNPCVQEIPYTPTVVAFRSLEFRFFSLV